ncbi:hypothetical protein C6401_15130 [Arthrobacter woluwensis]|uniref:hypothetical protein n=1 Tax=Arthrobacter woluwensis TaxID=156980 RepID=UPI000D1334E9|nr:hypothetical protein [Arthrobacter woluwensis]PSS42890.1 hypothetical protein C6401_15130 [Arthrobacter woluwensis]
MADHRAETSTQARYPWRAAVRTFVVVVIPAFIGLGLILPLVVDTLLASVGHLLPPEWRAWMTAAALALAAFAGALTKIAALPGVIAWTQRWAPWLAPEPKEPPSD